MHQSTLAELSSALESKKISSEELTRVYIERCKKHNVSLNCFITITEDEAIKKAKIANPEVIAFELSKIFLIRKGLFLFTWQMN